MRYNLWREHREGDYHAFMRRVSHWKLVVYSDAGMNHYTWMAMSSKYAGCMFNGYKGSAHGAKKEATAFTKRCVRGVVEPPYRLSKRLP